jgi:hypothetical protein
MAYAPYSERTVKVQSLRSGAVALVTASGRVNAILTDPEEIEYAYYAEARLTWCIALFATVWVTASLATAHVRWK